MFAVVSGVLGVLSFGTPGITTLVLLLFIAANAIVTGLLEVVTSIRVRKEIEGEGWIVAAGIASIPFGVLLILGAFRLREAATA